MKHLCPRKEPPVDLRQTVGRQLVLADSFEPYKLVYERCLVFNPGSFNRKRFGWSTYHPHLVEIRDRMEERCVPVSFPANAEVFTDEQKSSCTDTTTPPCGLAASSPDRRTERPAGVLPLLVQAGNFTSLALQSLTAPVNR